MECEQCYGTVNIENLAFSLNTARTAAEAGDIHYYMCLIHSDVTLLASDIVFPERNGDIILKGSFQFNNLTSDFKIYIKMYSMILEKDTRKVFTIYTKSSDLINAIYFFCRKNHISAQTRFVRRGETEKYTTNT